MLANDQKDNAAVLKWYLTSLVAVVGLVVVGGSFAKMNRGIRQQNLKAIGIPLIAVLVVFLVLRTDDGLEAAVGLLGTIAGYLFGKDTSSDDEDVQSGSPTALGANPPGSRGSRPPAAPKVSP